MKKYKRIFTVVIDSLGAGAMPDASEYGDAGTDTHKCELKQKMPKKYALKEN